MCIMASFRVDGVKNLNPFLAARDADVQHGIVAACSEALAAFAAWSTTLRWLSVAAPFTLDELDSQIGEGVVSRRMDRCTDQTRWN
jgi:hypothetical protein